MRDLILGQDIRAPSVKRQEIAEIEDGKSNNQVENKELTALKTTTTNVHGEEITTVTTTNYEQLTFRQEMNGEIVLLLTTCTCVPKYICEFRRVC